MKAALKKEIKMLLKENAPELIKERILPELYENMDDYVGMTFAKLANVDNDKEVDEATSALYEGMLEELIKQIKQDRSPAKKKITRKK